MKNRFMNKKRNSLLRLLWLGLRLRLGLRRLFRLWLGLRLWLRLWLERLIRKVGTARLLFFDSRLWLLRLRLRLWSRLWLRLWLQLWWLRLQLWWLGLLLWLLRLWLELRKLLWLGLRLWLLLGWLQRVEARLTLLPVPNALEFLAALNELVVVVVIAAEDLLVFLIFKILIS